ncbi:hypothetical protein BN85405190 [Alteracholeplasma palmae J233]|uniref:Uncharacterized protein n=1 Tax=Alteracholeplasma palmae (strain ATCC 49389 / J233) TaxID=1318466 RepID=U4KRE6_ALTPJ|nr:hypothetical protein [Alteracholeplasma palmae]CCV64096.1 hypothetical protein BN85405190 [Alteracholeplasma palmae J233]
MKTNKNDDQQTPNPYGIDKFSNIKPGIKIGFLKFWLAGASYLLSYMTPQLLSQDGSTELLALFIIMSLLTEYLVNSVIVWMNNDKQPTYKYLPLGYINRKSIWSLFASMLYVIVTLAITFFEAFLLNSLFSALKIPTLAGLLVGDSNSMEPITFGLLFVLADYIWLVAKRLILKIKKKEKK